MSKEQEVLMTWLPRAVLIATVVLLPVVTQAQRLSAADDVSAPESEANAAPDDPPTDDPQADDDAMAAEEEEAPLDGGQSPDEDEGSVAEGAEADGPAADAEDAALEQQPPTEGTAPGAADAGAGAELSDQAVASRVKAIIANVAGIDPQSIPADAALDQDLKLDPLSRLEIAADVDAAFQLSLPDERYRQLLSLPKLVRAVQDRLAELRSARSDP